MLSRRVCLKSHETYSGNYKGFLKTGPQRIMRHTLVTRKSSESRFCKFSTGGSFGLLKGSWDLVTTDMSKVTTFSS